MERPSWIDTPQRPPGDIMRQYALHLERQLGRAHTRIGNLERVVSAYIPEGSVSNMIDRVIIDSCRSGMLGAWVEDE